MPRKILLLVGTKKGAFFFESDERREDWKLTGPHLSGWDIYSLFGDGATRRIWAGTSHYAYGPTLRVSDDFGATWEQLAARPQYSTEKGWELKRIWQLTPHPTERDTLFAGVEEAGLFVTRDRGASWQELSGLTSLRKPDKWFPGNGGLCLHTILIDPKNPQRMFVGISAVGVFRSEDGGETWKSLNRGLPNLATGSDEPDSVCCVHKMVFDPRDSKTIYMQYHGGVFKSSNSGDEWKPIEAGLSGNFGFPMVITNAGDLFIAPLETDEIRMFRNGAAVIYRSRDGGATWTPQTRGLPNEGYFAGVLRDAMAVDPLSPAGVYFGTTMGDIFHTTDAGETWRQLPGRLPRVHTVKTMVIEG